MKKLPVIKKCSSVFIYESDFKSVKMLLTSVFFFIVSEEVGGERSMRHRRHSRHSADPAE